MPDCTAEQAAVDAAQAALTTAETAAAASAQQAMDDATTVLSKEIDLFNANLALLACQQGGSPEMMASCIKALSDARAIIRRENDRLTAF